MSDSRQISVETVTRLKNDITRFEIGSIDKGIDIQFLNMPLVLKSHASDEALHDIARMINVPTDRNLLPLEEQRSSDGPSAFEGIIRTPLDFSTTIPKRESLSYPLNAALVDIKDLNEVADQLKKWGEQKVVHLKSEKVIEARGLVFRAEAVGFGIVCVFCTLLIGNVVTGGVFVHPLTGIISVVSGVTFILMGLKGRKNGSA